MRFGLHIPSIIQLNTPWLRRINKPIKLLVLASFPFQMKPQKCPTTLRLTSQFKQAAIVVSANITDATQAHLNSPSNICERLATYNMPHGNIAWWPNEPSNKQINGYKRARADMHTTRQQIANKLPRVHRHTY